jgi:cytochrome P450
MLEMIHARRSSEKEDRHDLFSSLLDASEQEGENLAPGAIKDSELIGSSRFFLFLWAGHQTCVGCREYFHLLVGRSRGKIKPIACAFC